MKDTVLFNLSSRVHLENTYSASLFFESLELSDSGVYQCSIENGADMSSEGEITVLGMAISILNNRYYKHN